MRVAIVATPFSTTNSSLSCDRMVIMRLGATSSVVVIAIPSSMTAAIAKVSAWVPAKKVVPTDVLVHAENVALPNKDRKQAGGGRQPVGRRVHVFR